MDTITSSTLHSLASVNSDPCISIFMPTSVIGRDAVQDAVRLRNLVNSTERELAASGMDEEAARDFLCPILELPTQNAWKQRGKGLAIFHSRQLSVSYWLGASLDQASIIGQRFFIKPLLSLQSNPLHFFVLAISRNQPRLLKANLNGFVRLNPTGLPKNIKEALNLQGADRGEQVHSAMHANFGKEAGVFHGQGGHPDTLKEEVFEYFRLVDEAIKPVLRGITSPLILAGVDYELALYRRVCDYKFLSDVPLVGTFDYVDDHGLYAASLPLARVFGEESQRRAIARYMNQADTCLASDDLEEIMVAAHEGRIDLLLVKSGHDMFGRFDAETKTIEPVDETGPDFDLVEEAIEQSITHGGEVYAVDDKLSSPSPMHAIVRYW
jgi:hypothetical protein